MDFLMVATRSPRGGGIEVYPKFVVGKSNDLMIRGSSFYAIWDEEQRLWSTDEYDAIRLIDAELDVFAKSRWPNPEESHVKVLHLWDSENRMVERWHTFCQKDMRDSFHPLDEKLIFANTDVKKRDYASKRLPYPLENGECPAYEKLMSTLYDPDERHKIEWAIGSIVSGDSKTIQKFEVLYGPAGSGKSTVINIIQSLFEGYYAVFDAKALGNSNASFALESFKSNPLVAIQHDGDLSKIEDNTRLNSVVSHELMTVNEKFKSAYSNRFKAFLFMGTNKPVKITDAKSGLIRRLIDVVPSGRKVPKREYDQLKDQVEFELGAIASRCLDIYQENPTYYEGYIPMSMLDASNDMYNFVADSYFVFAKEDSVSLNVAWDMYKAYCEEAKVSFSLPKRAFKEELKNYFDEYYERDKGGKERNTFYGFRKDRFISVVEDNESEKKPEETKDKSSWLDFKEQPSLFDQVCRTCFAQYASDQETPLKKWDDVKSKLKDLDTTRLHYVKPPENHIVIDFDIPDKDGNKSFEKNLEAASKWPKTYAELSKSGAGIHLHYIYTGDVSKLGAVYEDHIEVKVFAGKSSLRRKLTKCNDLPIASLNSGLPLKGDGKVVNFEGVKSEKELRTRIRRNLNKEYHAATKPSVDFIYKILEDAYNSNLHYDVTDMRNAVLAFAANSSHQADYCIKLVNKMRFKSEESSVAITNEEQPIVFYDVEVFPNLFLVNWKVQGEGKPVVRMINPKPSEIEKLMRFRLVGFNCRRYDNHILYACMLGYTNEQLYKLSTRIVGGQSQNCFFSEAYNVSYTDVYDFAATKQSLKKWEIQLGIHHQELGLPWDQPVPEELWPKVAEYCDNDVIATEAVFNHLQGDFSARKILAKVAGLTVNDTTNTLTTKIIFGSNKKPQSQFNYRDMGDVTQIYDPDADLPWYTQQEFDQYTAFDKEGRPIFPGYKYEHGVSSYRDEKDVGEGGYAKGKPGIYGNVALLDIASMHPSSIIAELLFGKVYTARFEELKQARVYVKHEDWDKARGVLGGALKEFVDALEAGTSDFTKDDLSQALKIAINSVYGLTSAKFENAFRDPRNKDNIVAKRGALFMINLKHEVEKRGFTVAHIKTDSIKIPDATPDIIAFVQRYGKLYGYDFEHEATYERMCLVNHAVYIAKYATVEQCCALYGEDYIMSKKDICKDNKKHGGQWTATGTQFAVPYVFKTLFTHEPIEFEDLCETKSVQTALYLDFNETLPDVTKEENDLKKLLKAFSAGAISEEDFKAQLDILEDAIAKGHNYQFVGRVGQFCPMVDGAGGGSLVREAVDKYNRKTYPSATGANGYRWMESEMVSTLHKEAQINRQYYDYLVGDAKLAICELGDFEWFVSDDPYVPEAIHPWEAAEEDAAKIFAVR